VAGSHIYGDPSLCCHALFISGGYAGRMRHSLTLLFLLLLMAPWRAEADIYMLKNDADEIVLSNLQPPENASSYEVLVSEDASQHPASHASRPSPLSKASLPYAASVQQAARLTAIEPALLHAIMHVESGGNRQALSPRGAAGLMQLMPATARRYGVRDPLDARQNLLAAAQYLQSLKQQFHGDMSLMLAAYNAGPQAVIRHGYQVPPYAETQRYVPHVLQHYRQLQRISSMP
jgi:soluble lytic murein transglycosylase-like protein